MVTKVISELKFVSKLKIFPETVLWQVVLNLRYNNTHNLYLGTELSILITIGDLRKNDCKTEGLLYMFGVYRRCRPQNTPGVL